MTKKKYNKNNNVKEKLIKFVLENIKINFQEFK